MSSDSKNLKDGTIERREKEVAAIKCQCGQVGAATLEGNIDQTPQSQKSVLIDVSSGFYIRMQKKNFGKTEIACALCERVVLG